MKQYRVGLIRVLTTADPELLQLHGRLIEQYFPLLKVESRCIPDQPDGIHDDATMAMGGPKVVAMAEQMWKEGFEAIAATAKKAQIQKKMGADVIALSCTGMSTIKIAAALERELGIPVLDPVMCEGLLTLLELTRRNA